MPGPHASTADDRLGTSPKVWWQRAGLGTRAGLGVAWRGLRATGDGRQATGSIGNESVVGPGSWSSHAGCDYARRSAGSRGKESYATSEDWAGGREAGGP